MGKEGDRRRGKTHYDQIRHDKLRAFLLFVIGGGLAVYVIYLCVTK